MEIKKAVILAGGLGTRFLPITKSISKEMLPILDKPIIYYLIEEIKNAGIDEIIIVTAKRKHDIVSYFKRNKLIEKNIKNKPELLSEYKKTLQTKVKIVFQQKPKGSLHALLYAEKHLKNEPFLLLNGDDLVHYENNSPCFELSQIFEKVQKTIIGVQKITKNEACKYGIIDISKKIDNKNFEIKSMIEKPKKDAPSDFAAKGRYVISADAFELAKCLPFEKNELGLNQLFEELCRRGEIMATVYSGTQFDAGDKTGYIKAFNYFTQNSEIYKTAVFPNEQKTKKGSK